TTDFRRSSSSTGSCHCATSMRRGAKSSCRSRPVRLASGAADATAGIPLGAEHGDDGVSWHTRRVQVGLPEDRDARALNSGLGRAATVPSPEWKLAHAASRLLVSFATIRASVETPWIITDEGARWKFMPTTC